MSRVRTAFQQWPSKLVLPLLLATAFPVPAAEEQKPALQVVRAELLDSRDGYPIPSDSVFFPGETVHLVFNVAGFTRGEYDRVKLSYRLESFGPGGTQFAMTELGKFDTELAPQDKKWLPIIRHSPQLPPHAPGGTYKVLLTVVDELNNAETRQEFDFRVEGESVKASDILLIRDFAFRRGESGPKVASTFEAGETVWASFYITGYGLREDNTFQVESELKLVDEEGEVLFEFEPQSEKGSPFYPRRWLPARFRLDLDDDIPSGRYGVQLLVRDKLGERSYQTTVNFTVR